MAGFARRRTRDLAKWKQSNALKNLSGKTEGAITAWKSLAEDSIKAPKQLRQDAYLEMAEADNRVLRDLRERGAKGKQCQWKPFLHAISFSQEEGTL